MLLMSQPIDWKLENKYAKFLSIEGFSLRSFTYYVIRGKVVPK